MNNTVYTHSWNLAKRVVLGKHYSPAGEGRNIVIAPDLPGHGKSTESIADQDMQSYANAIVSLLEQQSEPVILVDP